MVKRWIQLQQVLSLTLYLVPSFFGVVSSSDGIGCAFESPDEDARTAAKHAERELFGETVEKMNHSHFSSIMKSMSKTKAATDTIGGKRKSSTTTVNSNNNKNNNNNHGFCTRNDNRLRMYLGLCRQGFTLVDIPIVYHVLPNQDSGNVGDPTITEAQCNFTTFITNQLFQIYDKHTQTSIQFASFRTDSIIVHDDFVYEGNCINMLSSRSVNEPIITKSPEWEFKFHVIICEHQGKTSGIASYPSFFSVDDVRHNAIYMDYRAIPCHDQDGNFLCETDTNNDDITQQHHHQQQQQQQQPSIRTDPTRWWTPKGGVVSHEFGHLLGLLHTFEGGCEEIDGGDGVSDTPAEDTQDRTGCPALLPYDKDRDLFNAFSTTTTTTTTTTTSTNSIAAAAAAATVVATAKSCGGSQNVCNYNNGSFVSCAACCVGDCPLTYEETNEPVLIDQVNFPACCLPTPFDDDDENENTAAIVLQPRDSCPNQPGVDPKTNIMSYSPDYCFHEFTPGQMSKMMAMTRKYKTIIYCNYRDTISFFSDFAMCYKVPCVSTATSVRCRIQRFLQTLIKWGRR